CAGPGTPAGDRCTPPTPGVGSSPRGAAGHGSAPRRRPGSPSGSGSGLATSARATPLISDFGLRIADRVVGDPTPQFTRKTGLGSAEVRGRRGGGRGIGGRSRVAASGHDPIG